MKTRLTPWIRLAAPAFVLCLAMGGCASQIVDVSSGYPAADRATATACGDRLGTNIYAHACDQRRQIQETALTRADEMPR